ncbi:MAG TPA: glycoside hydrolase family 2 TIM barrel-domain containing protein [Flavitalea sp.]|nr:glycoside hydrolase family 2 TIM barrel-domain containing protein [Flavitalea sp.]
MVLKEGWNMQSSVNAAVKGETVSEKNFIPHNWYKVSVPSTIIAGLLANKFYDFDPFFALNFEKLADPLLDKPWWFRKSFTLPATENGKTVLLKLHGINYKANVWLNGKLIADSTQIKGPFRIIELNITDQIRYKDANVLAIEVLRPFNPNRRDGDLAVDYADWIHYPPDYNGGIINNVEILTCNEVLVKNPLVTSFLDLPSLALAHLQVDADVVNYSDKAVRVVLKGMINNSIRFEQQVQLNPREHKQITFTPGTYKQLNIRNPKIWWPWQYGDPALNRISLQLIRNGKISNSLSENFGIRQITSQLINNATRQFYVNGKPILLRGGAWSPDIFQRRSPKRQEQEIRLIRDMHMNIVRSEGKMEDDHFYDLCDKYGLLVMTGWMCCGSWQYPRNWDAEERKVAMSSDSSVMYWLRNKACILAWLNGSDNPPSDTTVEKDWLQIEANLKWPNPLISTADESTSEVSGYSGVKMNGPYDWVPPIYWETDTAKWGGAWSFATEISPGPSIPPYESMMRFMNKDSIASNTSEWLYHCGTMQFGNTRIFDTALNERYGKSTDIHDYIGKAQLMNYEGHRAMMEAYALNKNQTATGVVQWMGSNPWPSLIWHTYDYFLYTAGTYFGMKKSLEPLHVQYSYKSKEVVVVNGYLQAVNGLQVKATIYNLDGTIKYANSQSTQEVPADGVKRCFTLPVLEGLTNVYFLQLELADKNGSVISTNWYWLSAKKDELDWKKSKWYYTPQSAFADFSSLSTMPAATVNMESSATAKGDSMLHTIRLTNAGKSVAFFLRLRLLKDHTDEDILPAIFEDNYISLAPGEKRILRCSYRKADAGGTTGKIVMKGWNLK